jgi:hypothetical protein
MPLKTVIPYHFICGNLAAPAATLQLPGAVAETGAMAVLGLALADILAFLPDHQYMS